MIDLKLPLKNYQNQLSIKTEDQSNLLWDPIRKHYYVLQPEEMVRQLLIRYLLEEGFDKGLMAVEKSIKINGRLRRFDLVVFDRKAKPFIIVECKSFSQIINQHVVDQILAYNQEINAPYQLITNGISTYCFRINKDLNTLESVAYIPIIT
ncbi:MAG TPA: type I restriction enzyme HsdR N-terminal domain-containing protein [Saprospiraceae bacterium]|nr:type I restriction enzyme HsdR N-terminal domain-containing protein [Saprospiraceae bacterium]